MSDKPEPATRWAVVVGNVGTVFDGTNEPDASQTFADYVELSKSPHGRATGESVTLFRDGEIAKEYPPVQPAAHWSVSVSHVDTCLSCYLQDHHNREGELLLGVSVDGTTTNRQVVDGLESEFASGGDDGFPEELDESHVVRAIGSYFSGADLDSPFDSSLEIPEENEEPNGEGSQAWFLVEWTRDDDEESDA